MFSTSKNLTDYNRLVKKLETIGLDGQTIGKFIAATMEDQPNLAEEVAMSNDKIGKS